MAEFEIMVFNDEGVYVDRDTDLYAFFLMPPKEHLVEIIKKKESDVVPRFVRVRAYVKAELLEGINGGFRIDMVGCDGEEFTVASKDFRYGDSRYEDDIDISYDLTKCSAHPFGLNGVRVHLRRPYITVPKGGIVPSSGTYLLTLKIYGTWGL